jgi:hypothetical protein
MLMSTFHLTRQEGPSLAYFHKLMALRSSFMTTLLNKHPQSDRVKTLLSTAMVFAGAALLPVAAQTTYLNETFETDTIGLAPANPSPKAVAQVLTAAGTGLIGTDNVVRFNDTSTTIAGYLEYNVGPSALGGMYVQFDLLNNAPVTSGSAANPLIFSVGNWNSGTALVLNSASKRSFAVEFNQTGASSTLKLKSDPTTYLSTTYNMALLQTVKIWVNDNDASTLSYTRPDNSSVGSLGANSFVVWINDSLVGAEMVSGYTMSNVGAGGNASGDATLGRVGFNTTTTVAADFLIDNLSVAEPAPVPEPSACVLMGFAGWVLVWARRRQAQ